jgi:hypothetical protein
MTASLRRSIWIAAATLLLVAALSTAPASAQPERYEYRVIHPKYGNIGTYTNVVDRLGDDTEVRTELKVAVRMLGIVVYRQEAHRTERWHGQRMVGFDSVTVTDGDRLEVHGEARDGGFLIRSPSGTVMAPANVHPSNPWSPMVLNSDAMMSTKTGKLIPVRVSGGEIEPVSLAGSTFRAHQYQIDGLHRDFVWFSDDGVPVAFRSDENGTMVDFVLVKREQLASKK